MNGRLAKFLNVTLFCALWSFIIVYLWIAYHRMSFPFELEWIEGGMVDQVQRIVQGEGVYIPPSVRFVPFLYPPLYFYLSAAASIVFDGGLFPLRLISFLSSLVVFAAIFLIVHNETRDWWAGLVSVGFFAATYRLSGAWLDIARVDSLFLALWLLFIFVVRGRKTPYRAVLAGILAGLAFLTKQLALVLCLPLIIYLLWCNWKYAITLLGAFALLVGTSTLIFDRASGGWYSFYIFGLLFGQTEWFPSQLLVFLGNDLLFHLPLAILTVLFYFVFSSQTEGNRTSFHFWLVVLVSALAGSFLTRMKVGGYDNVLLPAYSAIAICLGLGFHQLRLLIKGLPNFIQSKAGAMIMLGLLIQLALLGYNPYDQIPTRADLDAGYQLVHFVSSVEGEVYLPDHGYLSTLAGKHTFAHHSAIWDVIRSGQHTLASEILRDELESSIRQKFFSMIILDSDWNYCCQQIEGYYAKSGEVFAEPDVFYPVTGWGRRPSVIYLPGSSE